jgi:hypothetical protein
MPIHGEHTGSDQAAETVPELLADEEGSVALPELLLGVPEVLSDATEITTSSRTHHAER